ncbi:MAG: AAA family ATPase [Actinomycetales bacterium]|nr:AAA family ATPase [Actinomycetales bacterium]
MRGTAIMTTARMPFPRDPRDHNNDNDPDTPQDTRGDSPADTRPDTGTDAGGEVVAFPTGRRTDTPQDTRPDNRPDARVDTIPDTTRDTRPDTQPDTDTDDAEGPVAVPELVEPERLTWSWAVGWRHKARRLWVYRRRYAWNTFIVLGAWSARTVGWWFRGAYRSVRDFTGFIDDRQALAVANQAAGGLDGRADVDAWLRARAERHRELHDRRKVVRSRLALPLVLLVAVWVAARWFDQVEVVRALTAPALLVGWVAVGCWLVYYGRTVTAPFWPSFREPSPFPAVTNDSVTTALLATGIGQLKELAKNGRSPVDVIYRDDAAGGKVAETIPVPGVTTEMLTAKAVVIAGAMKRPPAMVHLSQAPTGVPGHVEILFLDIDPGRTKPRRFAYLGKPVCVGKPCTIGYDARNKPVRWALPGSNGITTGTPGSGKTAYLLQLACLAALDAEGAQLWLADFKGMGDYDELERVAHFYAADPDTTDTARRLRDALLATKKEVARRRVTLTRLKREGSALLDNNAAALTDRLARDRRYSMPWVLFIIDEVHEALADPIYGKEITELLRDLMKIGRACGLHVEIASQRTDADSIPTAISTLPILRVAFHQNGQPGNDAILGTGAYKRGIDATAFRRGAEGSAADDRGSCWFIGSEGGQPVRVRTTFVLPDVKRLITTAHDRRTKAGTLTGAAVGLIEQPEQAPAHSALDDVRTVFVHDEIALHGDVIYRRVATRHPGRWKSQAALMAALKAEAPGWKSPTVDVSQVRPADAPNDAGIERTRKGIRLAHLQDAITERDQRNG